MRVCNYASSFLGVLILIWGCASETPPAETPDNTGLADDQMMEEPEPAAGSGTSARADDDAWEGEQHAVDKAPGSAPAAASDDPETRTLEVIQKLVKDRRAPVRQCYEAARKEQPALQGDMVIHFVLDPAGKVIKAELNQARSTLQTPSVAKCAIDVINTIKFPPSSRGMETNVNYPYNFTP